MVTAAGAAGAAPQLAGHRVLVCTGGMPLGRKLTQGLARHGARVVEIRAAFADRAQAESLLADAAGELGGVDFVVHASATPQALATRPLESLVNGDWDSAVHRSFLATLGIVAFSLLLLRPAKSHTVEDAGLACQSLLHRRGVGGEVRTLQEIQNPGRAGVL